MKALAETLSVSRSNLAKRLAQGAKPRRRHHKAQDAAVLAEVPDPRRAQGKRYPLAHLLVFTVLALLCGARSYRGIITFLDQRRELLNRHFAVDLKRAPALNTLRTLLQSLETEDLEAAFPRHAKALTPAPAAGEKPVIALDGKT